MDLASLGNGQPSREPDSDPPDRDGPLSAYGRASSRSGRGRDRRRRTRDHADSNGEVQVVSPEGPDRPGLDAAYDRLVLEVLEQCGQVGDDRFGVAATRAYREGVTEACCRAVGAWLDDRLQALGWTQRELAERIGVDRSAVARWTAGGSISLGHLILVLVETDTELAELPWPARRELTLDGYLHALTFIRRAVRPEASREPLDREQFWCLYHVFAEPHWEAAVRSRDREALNREARRVIARVGQSLGHPPRFVRSPEALRETVEDWTVAWIIGLHVLPVAATAG